MSQQSNNHRPPPPQKRQVFDQDARPESKTPQPRPIPPANGTVQNRDAGGKVVYHGAPTGGTKTKSSPSGGAATKAKPKKRTVAAVVALSLVAVLLIGAFSLYNTLAKQIDGEKTEAGVLPEDVKTLPEYTGKGIVNMLICGLDYDNETADGFDSEDHIGRTDMILYMRYDTINSKVNLLQIPRDTFVGEDIETGGTGKINGLYFYSEDPNNRMAALARVVNSQLGLPVDYYVTIDMDAVKEIIDIKGTIQVYVPVEVSDPEHPEAVIAQGWRDFTSSEAEFFLRNRTSPTYGERGDIMRLEMQQSFYSALYREFKTLAPKDLLMWMEVLLWRVQTDMDTIQIGGLAQKALKLESADITFIRPPVSGAQLGNVSLVSLVPDETADLLNTYFRDEDQQMSVDELDIQTLPVVETIGVSPASIRTMTDIQSIEADP